MFEDRSINGKKMKNYLMAWVHHAIRDRYPTTSALFDDKYSRGDPASRPGETAGKT
jgi:hypothetical protein